MPVFNPTLPPVLYADEHLLVLNKPSGLLSVPGRGPENQDCLITRVQAHFPDALTVHRLDMATSGLIIMGRGPAMQRALSVLFQNRQVEKAYLAVVAGQLDKPHGQVDLPLICDWPNRPRQMVDHGLGKPSLTEYAVLEYDAARHTSRVQLIPHTGRSHQLRVHMQSLGHPILGDDLYAPPDIRVQAPRLLLHATELSFQHPATQTPLVFHCPADF